MPTRGTVGSSVWLYILRVSLAASSLPAHVIGGSSLGVVVAVAVVAAVVAVRVVARGELVSLVA